MTRSVDEDSVSRRLASNAYCSHTISNAHCCHPIRRPAPTVGLIALCLPSPSPFQLSPRPPATLAAQLSTEIPRRQCGRWPMAPRRWQLPSEGSSAAGLWRQDGGSSLEKDPAPLAYAAKESLAPTYPISRRPRYPEKEPAHGYRISSAHLRKSRRASASNASCRHIRLAPCSRLARPTRPARRNTNKRGQRGPGPATQRCA